MDAKSAVVTKSFFYCYYLPCSLKIFINVFAFLYVKANSKEIVIFQEKMMGPIIFSWIFSFFFRKMLTSAFLFEIQSELS